MTDQIEKVYEVVDATDDEMYFTQGVFLSLEEIVKDIESESDPSNLTDSDLEEYCKIEIRERKIGWSGHGKTVYTREWVSEYNEAADEYEWRAKTNA